MSASIAVILPAAGRSTRYGGPQSKLLETLAGRSVISRSIAPFLKRNDVGQVIIPAMDEPTLRAALDPSQQADERLRFCPGGASRAESVLAGLRQVHDDIEWIAVHDAARPLVTAELIEQTIAAARQYGAAVPALPVPLTIKQAVGPLPAKVRQTLPRHELWSMQTPQVMRRSDLHNAYRNCQLPLEQVTDDMQLIEDSGQPVWLIAGDERNLKITHGIDLHLAERHLQL